MRTPLICLCILLFAIAGCHGEIDQDAAIANVNSTNMQRLANLYFAFQTKNDWHGPADESAFKTFVRGFNSQKLARINVDPAKTDELFVSERDGQPFKIRYKVKGSAMGGNDPVIFESTGVGGKRQVGFLDMTQREVDDAEYELLWTGKEKPAATMREH